jgi:hypothetical protein
MKQFTKSFLIFVFTLVCSIAMAAVLRAEGTGNPGEELGVVCADTEHYCSHVVAMFSKDGTNIPPYREGQCVSKDKSCTDFWCGNRHCGGGIFGDKNVCCMTSAPGQSTEYKCAYSELSCPGNTQQLTIRSSPDHRS